MSLQLPAILSPPTSCIPTLALTVLAASAVAGVASPLLGSASGSGLRLSLAGSPMHQAVSCSTWFCLWTGSSPPVALHPALSGDAVTFDYGQPVLCPMGTFTPLLVRTLRRTRDELCSCVQADQPELIPTRIRKLPSASRQSCRRLSIHSRSRA